MPQLTIPLDGPTNRGTSRNADASESINGMAEPAQAAGAQPKVSGTWRKRPGTRLAYTISTDPVKCLFTQDLRTFGVSGTLFVELFANDVFLVRGSVAASVDPPTICSNGALNPVEPTAGQLFITSGGLGYIYDLVANTLTQITDSAFPDDVIAGEFFAGYFFALPRQTTYFAWSALYDGLSWDLLDQATRSWAPDILRSIKRLNTQIWLIGTETTEVWYATGDSAVFAPIQGALLDFGTAMDSQPVRMGQTLNWLNRNEHGGGQVVRVSGYTPTEITTVAINQDILQDAQNRLHTGVMWAMSLDGHDLIHLLFDQFDDPTPSRFDWVFDFVTGQWHQWAHWNTTSVEWEPFRGCCHAYSTFVNDFGHHFVGDRLTGAVYEISFDYLSDELQTV